MHLFLQTLFVSFLGFFLLLLVSFFNTTRKHVHHLPPGPPRLPIIRNLFQFISSCQHIYLHELFMTYGPLISLKLGFVPSIVISSADLAKEVTKTHDIILSNRPKLVAHQKLSYNGSDIALAPYGEHWRQFKKVCVLHLFSNKKVKSFCSIREEEIHDMVRKISRLSDEGRVVDLSELIICLTSNVICKIAFGRRCDYAICGRSFQDVLKDAQEMFVSFCFSDYFPFTRWIDTLIGTSSRLHSVFMELDRFYDDIIDDHLKSSRPKAGQEDIVDVLLDLQRKSSLGINITMNHIKGILMEIFLAGTDTSATTIIWVMTELINNPNSMKQAREEMRKVIGNKFGKIIKEEDVEKLVYLKAVIKETLRLHPAAPLLVPRETSKKCTIQGYEIEEKTLVYVSAWAIGRDPKSWENLEEFIPERFMGKNKEIDFRGQDFELIPFGFGRRVCPGIQMVVGLVAIVKLTLTDLTCLFDWTHKKVLLCLLGEKLQCDNYRSSYYA